MILAVCANPSIDTLISFPRFRQGHINRAHDERRYPGGKGVHVALGLAELGEDVVILGFWGGPTGDWIVEACEKMGIRCVGPRVADWTRTCLTLKTEDAYDHTEILGHGPLIEGDALSAFHKAYLTELKKSKVVTISGSLPRGVPSDFYRDLVVQAKSANIPSFIDCTGSPLTAALEVSPDGVHLNQHEAAECANDKTLDGATKYLAQKTAYAAITAGKEGLYLRHGDQQLHGKVVLEKVISAVGSGDCLVAGLVAAHARKLDLEETVRLAVACGAANCISEDLGMLRKADVERLLSQVVIT